MNTNAHNRDIRNTAIREDREHFAQVWNGLKSILGRWRAERQRNAARWREPQLDRRRAAEDRASPPAATPNPAAAE